MTHIGLRVVQIARAWVGTPYVHQASLCHAGADCLGLVRGVWRTLYGDEPEMMPAYSSDWGEASGDERLFEAAFRHLLLCDVTDHKPGDVLLFRMRDKGIAKHMGIQSGVGKSARFIHAYTGHGVIENPLALPWQRRIAARFRFPEGDIKWLQ
ncbi:MAG: NlpC/P60 family protein [Pseudoruegeria sp.]